MLNVLLTIHMIACVALVIAVMLQRSEGGALGMGGGGTGGLISGRGAAGVLVKTTMVLAAIFFVTSITMTALNNSAANEGSLLERQVEQNSGAIGAPTTTTPAAPTPATSAPDPLGTPSTTTTTPTPAPATPAPTPAAPARDPLAPATNTAPATTPPATTAPTTPAPTPENGGSPN